MGTLEREIYKWTYQSSFVNLNMTQISKKNINNVLQIPFIFPCNCHLWKPPWFQLSPWWRVFLLSKYYRQHVVFSIFFLASSIMFVRFIHGVTYITCVCISFAILNFIVWLSSNVFIPFNSCWHLSCYHV